MSDPAVVECAAYGVTKIRAQQEEEQGKGYENFIPPLRQNHTPLPPLPTESSTAVYANPGPDERLYEEL